jgi:hypothetical protein
MIHTVIALPPRMGWAEAATIQLKQRLQIREVKVWTILEFRIQEFRIQMQEFFPMALAPRAEAKGGGRPIDLLSPLITHPPCPGRALLTKVTTGGGTGTPKVFTLTASLYKTASGRMRTNA